MYKMKKNCFKNFMSGQFVFKMILMLLAVVTGGGVMATADLVEPQIGNEGVNPADKETVAQKEPVDPNVNDRLSPGGKKMVKTLQDPRLLVHSFVRVVCLIRSGIVR